MKRRILLLLALAGITTLAFLGCGSQSANLKLEDGVLSWDADQSADHYEVELNDISVTCKAEFLPYPIPGKRRNWEIWSFRPGP